jgi:hypothetical protein
MLSMRTFLLLGALCALIASASVLTGLTGANTVPPTAAGVSQRVVTPNDLKPAQCAGLNVATLVTGSGVISGGPGNSLILGSAADDTIYAGPGDTCIDAGAGHNICYTSPGVNVYLSCTELRAP